LPDHTPTTAPGTLPGRARATRKAHHRRARLGSTSPLRCSPCPQLPSGSLTLNTAQLHDGPQILTLLATNAAGNTTSVQSPTVVVDNDGPPAPSSLTATALGGGSEAVDLSWSDPASPPQPGSGAFVQLCQTSCGAAIAVNGSGGAQLTAPGPGTYTIRLWLVDQVGRGSAATRRRLQSSCRPHTHHLAALRRRSRPH
jgi:hypothetical protein